MELITYNGQNTLPEQVSVNKANIEILKDEVEKLGFTLRGPYDASTEYAYNDVVEYQYCIYRVSDEDATALVGVVPTNTTYWQKITDSLRGPQGAQGAQGPEGPAGADGQDGQDGQNGTNGINGKDALVYDYINDVVGNPQGRLLSLSIAGFNRTPVENDRLTIFMRDTASNDIYATNGAIASVAISYATYGVTTAYKITGATGAAGPEALCYDRNIAFTRSEDAEQLISVTLPFANFNRDPELNQDFVGILEDNGVCYVAQCEVQTISGTNVTSIVASDINRITGADGQNGTNGTDGTNGEPALVYSSIYSTNSDPAQYATKTLSSTFFNRTAKLNDAFSLVYTNINNGKTFLCACEITIESETNPVCRINAYVETTGAQGASGTSLTEYSFSEIQLTSTTTAGKLYRIIRNAKGNLSTIGYFTANSKIFRFVNSISAISNSIRIYCPAVSDGTETLTVSVNVGVPNWTSSSAFTVYDSSGNLVTTNGLNVYGYYYNDSEIS